MKALFWNLLALSLLICTPSAWASIPISQLQNHCEGNAIVLNTWNPIYSPGVPGHGRSNGIPANASFSASVQFSNGGNGCAQLDQKYNLGLDSKPITVSVSVPPISLQNTAVLAKSFVSSVVPVKFAQFFPYANGNQLPLFPLFHEEILNLSGHIGSFTLSLDTKVNTMAVYGVPGLKQLSDGEKLSLAQAIVNLDLQTVKLPGWNVPYPALLSSLEPNSLAAKVKYLNILISLLTSLPPEQIGDIAFFRFEVGGSDGLPIASEINSLATKTKALSPAALQNLVFLFPALMININSECLPIDAAGMQSVLLAWENSPLTYYQKEEAKNVSADLSAGGGVFDFCLQEFVNDGDLIKQAALTHAALLK